MRADLTLLPGAAQLDQLRSPATQKAPAKGAEAASQFEQIFLRKMLSALMKTTKLSPGSEMAGGEMYDTMVVDALSSSISDGGGIGIARLIEQRLDGGPSNAQGPPLPEDAHGSIEAKDTLSEQSALGRGAVREMPSSISDADRLYPVEVSLSDPGTSRRTR